jgi:hypothetical protein
MKILISESQFRYIITENVLLQKMKEKYVGEGKPVSEEKYLEICTVAANNTQYTIWLTKMVAENVILAEDIYKYKQYFDIFNKNKQHFPIKDINQIKTKEQVNEFLRKVIEIREMSVDKSGAGVDDSKKYLSVSEIKKLEAVGIKYLGMSEGFQVFQVQPECAGSEEAYKTYKNILGRCMGRDEGASIDICTMGSQSYFDDYLNDYPGSSYFVMYNLSDPQSPYQFHYESSQFMDKNDNDLLGR